MNLVTAAADLQLLATFLRWELKAGPGGQLEEADVIDTSQFKGVRNRLDQLKKIDQIQRLWVGVKVTKKDVRGAYGEEILKAAELDTLPKLEKRSLENVAFEDEEYAVSMDLLKLHTLAVKELFDLQAFDKDNPLFLKAPDIPGLKFSPRLFRRFLRLGTIGKESKQMKKVDWIALFVLGEHYGNEQVKRSSAMHIPISPNWRELPEPLIYLPKLLKELMLPCGPPLLDEEFDRIKEWFLTAVQNGSKKNQLKEKLQLIGQERDKEMEKKKKEAFYSALLQRASELNDFQQRPLEDNRLQLLHFASLKQLAALPLEGLTVLEYGVIAQNQTKNFKKICRNAAGLKSVAITLSSLQQIQWIPESVTYLCLDYSDTFGEGEVKYLPSNLRELVLNGPVTSDNHALTSALPPIAVRQSMTLSTGVPLTRFIFENKGNQY